MQTFQRVRGTADRLAVSQQHYRWITDCAQRHMARYGFLEVATPILETRQLFERAVAMADIANKEMFCIQKRGQTDRASSKEDVVLRPEGTSSVVRAILNADGGGQGPYKFFYQGPMFRYDRPQKGRAREFHQVGLEHIGDNTPWADVEAMACAWDFLKDLGLEKRVTLELNTIGTKAARATYCEILQTFLEKRVTQLSPESQARLEKNPLRILDSKDPKDHILLQEAPRLSEALSPEDHQFFQEVCAGLDALNIPYRLNPFLVRGLDYYDHTTFEWTTTELGAQATVLAGGRYNGLVSLLGGPTLTGVGWACGVERLMLMTVPPSPPQNAAPLFYLLPVQEHNVLPGLKLAHHLRQRGLNVTMMADGPLGKRLKKVHKRGGRFALILGDEEIASGHMIWKDLENGHAETVSQKDFLQHPFNMPSAPE